MRYSLIGRVRGIFLGAFLGESLATHNRCDLGAMTILGVQSLIEYGRLDVDNWLKRYQQAAIDLNITDIAWGEIILATLPVVIFFHEDTVKLKKNLLQVLKIWDTNPVMRDAALVIGYVIGQSLTEKLDPITLIPQTISFLGKTTTSVPQNLLKVNSLLAQDAGLEQVRDELTKQEELSSNIALVIYCFLSTLEDFRLTVLRVNNHTRKQEYWCLGSQSRSAITGALSGAYNTTVGIPVNWQVLFQATNSPAWGLKNFSQMLELADILVEVWSGVYTITPNTQELTKPESGMNENSLSIYAAPSVIRPR
ncbi:ADP-ribosylglycohydrolase family protein [Trichormus azollae]|uniref:ADP-ribosylglycohydrolase family protein n=1 Tax=Trichormus azollae TaxID=1164 RepID=UPI00325E8683